MRQFRRDLLPCRIDALAARPVRKSSPASCATAIPVSSPPAPDPALTLIHGSWATLTSCAAAVEIMADSDSLSVGPSLSHFWMAGVRSVLMARNA